jgi:hypothetical protein
MMSMFSRTTSAKGGRECSDFAGSISKRSLAYVPYFKNSNIYVQRAAINGTPIDMTKGEIRHAQLVSATPSSNATTLEFWMTSAPTLYR